MTWLICTLLILASALGPITSATAQPVADEPQGGYRLVLPAVMNGAGNGGGGAGGGGGSPLNANQFMPYALGGGIMANRNPQLGVDAAGGLHMIYAANSRDAYGRRPAYYAECASHCDSPTGLTIASLGDQVETAQLALDPVTGQPRILLSVVPDPTEPRMYQYVYGECVAVCTDPAHWTLTPLLAAPTMSYRFPSSDESQRSFALDPQGRPAFVFHAKDSYWADGGMFYADCLSGCASASNWNVSLLGDGEWRNPALAFAPGGLPRLAFTTTTQNQAGTLVDVLGYLECTTRCAGSSGYLPLVQDEAGPKAKTYALRLTASGQPRLALYTGTGTGTLAADRLYYLACDSACAQNGAGWTARDIGLPPAIGGYSASYGARGLDLALDSQDQPRLVYHIDSPALYELGYAWCDSLCASGGAAWQHDVVSSTSAADQELGHIRYSCPTCFPPIPDCVSFWDGGEWPSLALDQAGNPRVVFEVQLQSGGGACSAETLARFSRLAAWSHP